MKAVNFLRGDFQLNIVYTFYQGSNEEKFGFVLNANVL